MNDEQIRVLIIDDEEQIRNLLVAVLGGIYRCRTASSAEEALTALAGATFDFETESYCRRS